MDDFERLPVAASVFELDGTILAVNEAGARLFVRPASEIVGRMAWDFAPGADHIWNEVVASARQGDFSGDITIATPVGPRAIHYVVSLRAHEQRTVALIVAVETRSAEDESNQRLEALGVVAGGIAHDFNNQLVTVLAEASAAREDDNLSDRVRDSLRRVEAAAQRMALLTRQLLAYAGRSHLDAELLDPDELLKDLRDELARIVRPDAMLSIQLNSTRVTVRADRTLLRDVLNNVLANASEALPPGGGAIGITTTIVARDSVTWWRLEIADSGVGLDPYTAGRIFDPFFTTKPDRHGLGLSAVHGIVRKLGGDINVDSQPGKGTSVVVRLPVVAGVAPRTRRTRPSDEPGASLRGLTILVADDEPSVRATIRRLLERRGASVIIANDGDEAESLLSRASYGLVLLDVMMPGRTGYQLLPTVRRLQPGAKLMLMSGYSDSARGHGGEDEPDLFLEKPFTAKQMDDAVDRVLAMVSR